MINFWCEQAWVGGMAAPRVRIGVDDRGKIGALSVDQDRASSDIFLPGLIFPGFANAHSHVFHRALRGRTQAADQHRGSFWTWRELMYRVADRLDPDNYFELARAAYAEMVLTGICAVAEFHYVHHAPGGRRYANPNAMAESLMAAAAEAGIRLTLLDTCYLHGGMDQHGYRLPEEIQLRFCDDTVESWRDRHDQLTPTEGVLIGAAIHSVRGVHPLEMPTVVTGAAGGPLHVHLSEQVAENQACQGIHGLTPTALLAESGVLGPQTTAIHATHLNPADIALLGQSGTGVCLCPTTERDLADGIGPGLALHQAGSPLSVGSDSQAVIDLIEEVRGVEAHERLAWQVRGCFNPGQQVDFLTSNGYRALGRPADGQIAVGANADLVAMRTDSIRTAGTVPSELLTAATAADVTEVVIGGVRQVQQGQHRLGEVGSLLQKAIDAMEAP